MSTNWGQSAEGTVRTYVGRVLRGSEHQLWESDEGTVHTNCGRVMRGQCALTGGRVLRGQCALMWEEC